MLILLVEEKKRWGGMARARRAGRVKGVVQALSWVRGVVVETERLRCWTVELRASAVKWCVVVSMQRWATLRKQKALYSRCSAADERTRCNRRPDPARLHAPHADMAQRPAPRVMTDPDTCSHRLWSANPTQILVPPMTTFRTLQCNAVSDCTSAFAPALGTARCQPSLGQHRRPHLWHHHLHPRLRRPLRLNTIVHGGGKK